MSRASIERRLRKVGSKLTQTRAELAVVDEQLLHFEYDADDARLRSLVSETHQAGKEHREARKHVEAMLRDKERKLAAIAELEKDQDALLDRLTAER
ncbi:MAG: hypothetical protein GY929_23130 [Actinomycetia bacterium]|nr:hypothetical protein [Actinomycetes bacterium]